MTTYDCSECGKPLTINERFNINDSTYCREHYLETNSQLEALKYGKVTMGKTNFTVEPMFNEPAHYHKHDLDTITFLQGGFSPEVFSHFCVSNIIKYVQRYPYKNGRDDLEKIVDYAKRLLEWHDKNNPS